MKRLILLLLSVLALSGCSNEPRPDGWCAMSAEGICLLKWRGGVKVPSGEIDTRYAGAVCEMGSNGVNSKAPVAMICSGSTTTTGREWF